MTDSERNPNSALYWLPLLERDEILRSWLPHTVPVHYDHARLIDSMEGAGEYPEWERVIIQARHACRVVGWPVKPVFIKTDLTSAKHDGPQAYLASHEDSLTHVLLRTAEDSEMKLWLMGQRPEAFLFRQYLALDSRFRAFGGLPIAREWRFFASAEAVLCAHPYWPEEAIEFSDPEPPGWKSALRELHALPPDMEWVLLNVMARKAAQLCTRAEAWSVDFARDRAGKWWLIDCAVANESWHWPGCPTIGERLTGDN